MTSTKTPEISSFVPNRTIVLTGMMGAGKTSVGRKLAARLKVPFFDSDVEIEAAAGMSITDFFNTRGEPEFRQGERRVIARLLEGPVHVLSTGGGAFIDNDTRTLIEKCGISIWLKADTEVLLERALRRDNRPLLQGGDPKQKLTDLLAKRESTYALADIVVETDTRPVDETVERTLKELEAFVAREKTAS